MTDGARTKLAAEVRDRLEHVGLLASMRELSSYSKVAAETWDRLLNGEPVRADAVRRMETALGGPSGVFRRIMEGEPFEWGPPPVLDVNQRLDRLERLVVRLMEQMGVDLPDADRGAR